MTVEIKQGALIADMADALVAADVVKSTKAFIEAAEENSRSKNIQPGTYKLRKQMSGDAAVVALLDLKNKIVNGITIPEGLTAKTVYKRLSRRPTSRSRTSRRRRRTRRRSAYRTGGSSAPTARRSSRRSRASCSPTPTRSRRRPPPRRCSADGGQLPHRHREPEFAENVQANRGGISPYEVLVVASLSQAEAGNKDDLGKIARVAYNRVYSGNFPCNCLQFDVSVNYYWELTGKPTKASKDMRREELYDEKNPYSTHARPGLPPTPINNPGKQALEGR
ncbi:endolytic transglycosylase MltG [Micromonospora sp. BRA006-A]|nr:endolytic transglycosylase MltG [Micromonospora sp. BRA006-A]